MNSPAGALEMDDAVLDLVSVSLETLFARRRGFSLLSAGLVGRNPNLRAVSDDILDEVLRDTVASESLRADMDPSLVRRGCASMSMRDGAFLPDGGLDVELVVDTSDATDTRSASARSVSDVSPSRARLRRDALVGRG